MSYGALVTNESGTTQIDSSLVSYQILEQGSFTGTKVWPTSFPSKTLMFIKPYNNYISGSLSLFAQTFTVNGVTRTTTGSTSTVAYTAVIPTTDYTSPPYSASYGFGLAIRDSSGSLSFSSEIPVMKIRGTRSIQLQNSGWNTYWYQGTTHSEINNLYFLADGYEQYGTTITGPQADLIRKRFYRKAIYDYTNNRFGTTISVTTTDNAVGPAFSRFYTGYKTEVIGIAI